MTKSRLSDTGVRLRNSLDFCTPGLLTGQSVANNNFEDSAPYAYEIAGTTYLRPNRAIATELSP